MRSHTPLARARSPLDCECVTLRMASLSSAKTSAGPGGPFRILGWSTPIDAETSLSYFLRMRHVSGWQRRLWDVMYGLYLERNHWHVLEQDRRILESPRGVVWALWGRRGRTG